MREFQFLLGKICVAHSVVHSSTLLLCCALSDEVIPPASPRRYRKYRRSSSHMSPPERHVVNAPFRECVVLSLPQCTSCCVSFPVFRPEMLGIMAGMDQEAWFAGFDVVPRAVLLLVSQAPDARHHGRHGPQDSVRFTGAVLGQGFLYARCCATCVLVQTVFYTVAFPQLQFITVLVVAFTLCSPFFVGRPMLPSVYTAWTVHCWRCSSWTSCSRPSLYNARCRLCHRALSPPSGDT